ncbi:MAG TPA: nuclear transport factor 2 family protein [Vicinamibacterales bacterium]|nr:nuclear transport factor 2 family protein [Vicinamibacterales bacterium]
MYHVKRQQILQRIHLLILALAVCLPIERPAAQGASRDTERSAAAAHSTIERQEQAVWNAIRAQDGAAFRKLMADDCVIVSAGRRYTADEYAAVVRTLKFTKSELTDIKVLPLSTDAALIQYRLHVAWTQNNKESVADQYVVSVWKRFGSRWLVVFNEDSPAAAPVKPLS